MHACLCVRVSLIVCVRVCEGVHACVHACVCLCEWVGEARGAVDRMCPISVCYMWDRVHTHSCVYLQICDVTLATMSETTRLDIMSRLTGHTNQQQQQQKASALPLSKTDTLNLLIRCKIRGSSDAAALWRKWQRDPTGWGRQWQNLDSALLLEKGPCADGCQGSIFHNHAYPLIRHVRVCMRVHVRVWLVLL